MLIALQSGRVVFLIEVEYSSEKVQIFQLEYIFIVVTIRLHLVHVLYIHSLIEIDTDGW